MKEYKYFLFDLDGTLTEPKEGITKSVQYALAHFGIREENLDNLVCFIGPPLLESFQKYYHFSQEDAVIAREKYRERYVAAGMFENAVMEGMPELLQDLKDRGAVLAVATSKPEVMAKTILEKYDMSKYFQEIVGSGLNGERDTKAEVIEEALCRLDINSEEKEKVLMIGDRLHDIHGAKVMGIDSLGVYMGYAEPGELEREGADYIAATVEELRGLLLSEKNGWGAAEIIE
ncbi:MAG: HAD-IA family hydrolase [Clostridiales bacterium]|nr:HAD-IA family hydrolase [Clostridiales bacterium]